MPPHRPLIEGKKECSKCRNNFYADEFGLSTRAVDSINSWCKLCRSADSRRWFKQNKEKGAHTRWLWKIKTKYNMTQAVYDEMLERQSFLCGICGGTASPRGHFDIDHDHSTGTVRGLLCRACNQGLGLILDDISIIGHLIQYLDNTIVITAPDTFPSANLTRQCCVFLRKYSMVESDYISLWNRSGGTCYVCCCTAASNGKMLAVDHSHETGAIRGLLCSRCNLALGKVVDNTEILYLMTVYLALSLQQ